MLRGLMLLCMAGATGMVEDAIAAYRELGWLLEDDASPWIALAELLESDDHHAERAEALVAVGSRTQGEQKVRALCEAARIQLARLDDRVAAGNSYQEAFNEDPTDDEAFVFLTKRDTTIQLRWPRSTASDPTR